MNLTDVIHKRHSVRKFKPIDIPDDIIQDIVELASEAPSAGGLRSYHVVITNQKVTNQVDAPKYIVILADQEKSAKRYGDRGKNLYAIQDATILGAYIQLIATDMGFATVWIGAFRENRVRRDLKTNLLPVAIIPIGYEL